ncbi:hypothetical protein ACSSS7_001391 [Eimeria intestinalis]
MRERVSRHAGGLKRNWDGAWQVRSRLLAGFYPWALRASPPSAPPLWGKKETSEGEGGLTGGAEAWTGQVQGLAVLRPLTSERQNDLLASHKELGAEAGGRVGVERVRRVVKGGQLDPARVVVDDDQNVLCCCWVRGSGPTRPSVAARQASRSLRDPETAAIVTEVVCVDSGAAEDSRQDEAGRDVGYGDAERSGVGRAGAGTPGVQDLAAAHDGLRSGPPQAGGGSAVAHVLEGRMVRAHANFDRVDVVWEGLEGPDDGRCFELGGRSLVLVVVQGAGGVGNDAFTIVVGLGEYSAEAIAPAIAIKVEGPLAVWVSEDGFGTKRLAEGAPGGFSFRCPGEIAGTGGFLEERRRNDGEAKDELAVGRAEGGEELAEASAAVGSDVALHDDVVDIVHGGDPFHASYQHVDHVDHPLECKTKGEMAILSLAVGGDEAGRRSGASPIERGEEAVSEGKRLLRNPDSQHMRQAPEALRTITTGALQQPMLGSVMPLLSTSATASRTTWRMARERRGGGVEMGAALLVSKGCDVGYLDDAGGHLRGDAETEWFPVGSGEAMDGGQVAEALGVAAHGRAERIQVVVVLGEAGADHVLTREIDAKQGRERDAWGDKERRGRLKGTKAHFKGDAAEDTEVVTGDTQDGAVLAGQRGIPGSRVRGRRAARACWQVEGWGVSGSGVGAGTASAASDGGCVGDRGGVGHTRLLELRVVVARAPGSREGGRDETKRGSGDNIDGGGRRAGGKRLHDSSGNSLMDSDRVGRRWRRQRTCGAHERGRRRRNRDLTREAVNGVAGRGLLKGGAEEAVHVLTRLLKLQISREVFRNEGGAVVAAVWRYKGRRGERDRERSAWSAAAVEGCGADANPAEPCRFTRNEGGPERPATSQRSGRRRADDAARARPARSGAARAEGGAAGGKS